MSNNGALSVVDEAVASLGMVTPGAELHCVTRLAKAINYSTYKGWRPMEGISHFTYRILYCKIDIVRSRTWGELKKCCFLL